MGHAKVMRQGDDIRVDNIVSDNVDIDGGAIDDTPIGASTASTGAFSDLQSDGLFQLTGENTLTKSGAYTVQALDSGYIIDVDTTAVITLPATVLGLTTTIRNIGADGGVQITVSPNASDKIIGAGDAGVDDKDRVNTLATAEKGDYIKLVADGTDGWFIVEQRGTWAVEA